MMNRPTIIRKTVSLDPATDKLIRGVLSYLVNISGITANYSTALNLLIIAAALETQDENGWSQNTRERVSQFLNYRTSIASIVANIDMRAVMADITER
jgi:hypothetical protein